MEGFKQWVRSCFDNTDALVRIKKTQYKVQGLRLFKAQSAFKGSKGSKVQRVKAYGCSKVQGLKAV